MKLSKLQYLPDFLNFYTGSSHVCRMMKVEDGVASVGIRGGDVEAVKAYIKQKSPRHLSADKHNCRGWRK